MTDHCFLLELELAKFKCDGKPWSVPYLRTLLAAIAEFEKVIMLERQREGIDIAKEDGKYKDKGRKPIEETKLQQVQILFQGGMCVSKAVSEGK